MRWLLAGLLFALAVAMAIGTAAIRAENVRRRLAVEDVYTDIKLRGVELRRMTTDRIEETSPHHLAEVLWEQVLAEAGRRQESMQ